MNSSRPRKAVLLLGMLATLLTSCGRNNPSAPIAEVRSDVRIDLGLSQALECTVYESAALDVNGRSERTQPLDATGRVTFENVTVETGTVTFEINVLSNGDAVLVAGSETTTVRRDGFEVPVRLDPVAGILVLDTCSLVLLPENGFRGSVQVQNIGSVPLQWTALGQGTPLEFSPGLGNLGPGAVTTVEVSFPVEAGVPDVDTTFSVGMDQRDLAGSLMGDLDLQVRVPIEALEKIGFDGIPPGTRDPVVTVPTGTVSTSAVGCSGGATIYDTSAGHAADPDLNAQPAQAEVLIIEQDFEDISGDGFPDDCDVGGMLMLDFSDVGPSGTVTLISLRLLDIDGEGTTIDLFGPNETPITLGIPVAPTGDGTITLPISLGPTSGVAKMVINFVSSGAVDDIVFVPDP